jgi:hypothetical protein
MRRDSSAFLDAIDFHPAARVALAAMVLAIRERPHEVVAAAPAT